MYHRNYMDVPATYAILTPIFSNPKVRKVQVPTTPQSISGYAKTDVAKALEKAILDGKVEEACYWSTELHISGQIDQVWKVVLQVVGRDINISNPKLPAYLAEACNRYTQMTRETRQNVNVQEARHIVADIVAITTLSPKNRLLLAANLPKVSAKEFEMPDPYSKLKTKQLNLVQPDAGADIEVLLVVNDMANYLHYDHPQLGNVMYWYVWLEQLEKYKKRNNVELRGTEYAAAKDKYRRDWVWTVWLMLLREAAGKSRALEEQVRALFDLYSWKFTPGSRTRKKYLIFNAMLLFSDEVDWSIVPLADYHVWLQVVGNVNRMYKRIMDPLGIAPKVQQQVYETWHPLPIPTSSSSVDVNAAAKAKTKAKKKRAKVKKAAEDKKKAKALNGKLRALRAVVPVASDEVIVKKSKSKEDVNGAVKVIVFD